MSIRNIAFRIIATRSIGGALTGLAIDRRMASAIRHMAPPQKVPTRFFVPRRAFFEETRFAIGQNARFSGVPLLPANFAVV
jgi:hypothetical protein